MGRIPADNLSLIHPVLYLSFFAAGLIASIAIMTALCSVRFRKKESDPPDPLESSKDSDSSTRPLATATAVDSSAAETGNDDLLTKELPLPPALQQAKEPNINNIMKRTTSERKLSMNFSIKMPRTLSLARNWDHHKEDNRKGKLKPEDSVWMKTIILGDKCKVPDEENAVIYEGKGKKISAYHPKHSTSMSVSRQPSFKDPEANPVPSTQNQQEKDQ
ncbi:hypothetical protein L6164_024490 [Bauhinia variegata]|uniref:Uncharacterized protein n=1 Tax=Bauhinia variegata TaxID=167791 RepID=A0ACB9LXS8_BAUVA|nr:hypothetical protein L6164_024490 [Bauhinia variegata]